MGFFQPRQPAFWLYVVIVVATGVVAFAEQSFYRNISASGWALSWLLLALYALPVFLVVYFLDLYEREPLSLVLGALLWTASVLSDDNRIPGLLAHAAKESGVMYCTEGRIVRGDGSLLDRAVEPGTFRCTNWKLRGEGSYTVKAAMPWPTSPRR